MGSIVIVTHGDAVGAIVGMLRYDWKVQNVPYAAYAVASRRVPVLDRGSDAIKLDELVYEQPEQWALDLRGGIEVTEVHACSKKRAQALHKHELKKICSNSSISSMDSSYLHKVGSSGCIDSMDTPPSPKSASSFDAAAPPEDSQLKPFSDYQLSGFRQTLSGFGANSSVSARLVKLAGCSRHLADESKQRMTSPRTLTRTATL